MLRCENARSDESIEDVFGMPQVREEYEGLRKRRLDEFMAGFSIISLKLKEMYQMITLGGDAELELVDSLDPFSEVRISWLGKSLHMHMITWSA